MRGGHSRDIDQPSFAAWLKSRFRFGALGPCPAGAVGGAIAIVARCSGDHAAGPSLEPLVICGPNVTATAGVMSADYSK